MRFAGSPEFTNEVQHHAKVLPWRELQPASILKTDARLPGFMKPATRSAKSRQLWIARHRRLSGAEAQSRPPGRLQARLRPAAGPSAALERLQTGAGPRSPHSSSAVLQRGWSPEQVAGWLRQQKAPTTISHETIYRFIYAQIRRTKDYDWRHYLPRAKFKRGYRGRKGGSPCNT